MQAFLRSFVFLARIGGLSHAAAGTGQYARDQRHEEGCGADSGGHERHHAVIRPEAVEYEIEAEVVEIAERPLVHDGQDCERGACDEVKYRQNELAALAPADRRDEREHGEQRGKEEHDGDDRVEREVEIHPAAVGNEHIHTRKFGRVAAHVEYEQKRGQRACREREYEREPAGHQSFAVCGRSARGLVLIRLVGAVAVIRRCGRVVRGRGCAVRLVSRGGGRGCGSRFFRFYRGILGGKHRSRLLRGLTRHERVVFVLGKIHAVALVRFSGGELGAHHVHILLTERVVLVRSGGRSRLRRGLLRRLFAPRRRLHRAIDFHAAAAAGADLYLALLQSEDLAASCTSYFSHNDSFTPWVVAVAMPIIPFVKIILGVIILYTYKRFLSSTIFSIATEADILRGRAFPLRHIIPRSLYIYDVPAAVSRRKSCFLILFIRKK